MEFVKPLRLGVLQRPYRWQSRQHLALTVVALVALGEAPVLLPELELWELVDEIFPPDGLLDLLMPKPAAEFMVFGNAYTHHQEKKTACAVEARVGDRKKRLTIFGDRYWIAGRATNPTEFDVLPIGRERAYGGPGFAENPVGIGHAPEQIGGRSVQRVPNVEHAHELLNSPRQVTAPAGFGMVDVTAPTHMAMLGKYDQRWLQQEAPGFPDSFDLHYFNVAPKDQQWRQQDRLLPGLEYSFVNMHPELPVVQGRLPDAQARCFVTRSDELGKIGPLEEVPLRLTTVSFVPHEECAILLYHGSLLVKDEQASDVRHVLPAFEATGAPRPIAHYAQVLERRIDERDGDLYVFDDAALISEALIGSGFDTDPLGAQELGPLERNLLAKQQRMYADEEERMRRAGINPRGSMVAEHKDIPKLTRLADLPQFEVEMKRKEGQLLATIQAERARALSELGAQPDSPMREQLIEQLSHPERAPVFDLAGWQAQLATHSPAALANNSGPGRALPAADDTARRLRQFYLNSVAFCGAAAALPVPQAQALRAKVIQRYQRDRDLSAFDLTGADLSHLDLSGARLTGAPLESANLEGTRLDGADLRNAILARTQMKHSSLRGADCRGANLSHAMVEDSCLADASFGESDWQDVTFKNCDFSRANFVNLTVQQSDFYDCRFLLSEWSDAEFLSCTLRRPDFSESTLHASTWMESVLDQASFASATLDNCSWVETDAIGIVFADATLSACYAVFDSNLTQADFTGARLRECNFRDTQLVQARMNRTNCEDCDWSGARLQGADLRDLAAPGNQFIGTDLSMAQLHGAILMHAVLRGTDLRAADLRAAHLFGADLALAWMDASTVFDDVRAERVNVYPRRDREAKS